MLPPQEDSHNYLACQSNQYLLFTYYVQRILSLAKDGHSSSSHTLVRKTDIK